MCDSTNRGGNKCGDKVSAGVEAEAVVEAGAEVGLGLGRAEGLVLVISHVDRLARGDRWPHWS